MTTLRVTGDRTIGTFNLGGEDRFGIEIAPASQPLTLTIDDKVSVAGTGGSLTGVITSGSAAERSLVSILGTGVLKVDAT